MPDRDPYKPKFGYDIRVRPPGQEKKRRPASSPTGRGCEWPGCEAKAEHKAPKSRDNVHEYQWFCLDHVKEFNKSWNFFDGWQEDDVRRFQKDASTGHRPTWRMGDGSRNGKRTNLNEAEDPLGLFERTRGYQAPKSPVRRLPKQVQNAFTVMGLEPPASSAAIKSRYKELVKKFHPDANHGEKGFEERLKRIIDAYQNLKTAGFCD